MNILSLKITNEHRVITLYASLEGYHIRGITVVKVCPTIHILREVAKV